MMSRLAHRSNHFFLVLGAVSLLGCGDVERHVNSLKSLRVIQTDGYRFDFSGEKVTHSDAGEVAKVASVIVVENQFGDVNISVTEETPRWEWELTCWADTSETAEKYATSITLQTDSRGNEQSWRLVLPTQPHNDLRGVESNLTLFVPSTVRVDLQNSHGNSKVDGVAGGTKTRCRHGNLDLLNLAGKIDAATEHGSLNASQISSGTLSNEHGNLTVANAEGALQVASSHGNVTLESIGGSARIVNRHGRVKSTDVAEGLHVRNEHGNVEAVRIGGAVDVATSFAKLDVRQVSGELKLRNKHGAITVQGGRGKVDAATVHGSIEIESPADMIRCRNEHGSIRLVSTSSALQSLDAETSFGELDVSLAVDAKTMIEAGTEHGKLESDLPVLHLNASVDNFAGAERSLPRITLKNSHGNIRVKN